MSTSRTDIFVEVVKVLVLSWFLYYAFNDATFPKVLWKPAGTLLKGGLIAVAYLAGHRCGRLYKKALKSYLIVFYCVGILTLISWAGLGTHTEGGDPYLGGGREIVDFIPSADEKDNHALTIFLTLLIPAIYGVYKANKKPGLS